jgi:hypothetical protein
VQDPTQLESFFAEGRRVIILEELERTFLRTVGGFGAVRELQRLISSTGHSTLWILAINQMAYRFLNASVGLNRTFSHRIDTATATREDLREAIMLRHNLSGLRLHFPPLAVPNRPWEKMNRSLRGRQTPETVFFEVLSNESSGIFRTAFDIWLGQIEKVQSGILYMKPLLNADLSALIDDLGAEAIYTLVSILQHGSLTAEEHALLFHKELGASRAQIGELMSREIIEAEPGRASLRIRPEAMRVVREVLYRRNLL